METALACVHWVKVCPRPWRRHWFLWHSHFEHLQCTKHPAGLGVWQSTRQTSPGHLAAGSGGERAPPTLARRPPSTQLHGLWTTAAPGAPSSRPVRTLQLKPAGCGLDGQAASSVQLLPDVFSEPLDRSNHSANPPSRDSNTDLSRRPRGSLADEVAGEAWRLVRRAGLPSLGLRAKPCREKGQDSDSVQQRVRPGVQVPNSSYR